MVYSNKKGMLFVALAFVWISVTAQTFSKNDQLKFDADYYIMDKDYKRALGNYLTVLKSEPDNADIKYRAAICYMNIEGERDKAIPLLEEAVQKVSVKYNPGSFKETRAPMDAWFLLGSAYRINNRLDDAIHAYMQFKNNLDPGDEYNLRVTDQYIRQCERAKVMLERPVRMVTSNLGKPINTETSNFNAVFSVDRKIMLYTSPGRQGYDIFYSTFGDTAWSTPKNITSVLATGKFMTTSDLSDDGKTLLLIYEDQVNSDLFISRFDKGRWSKVEPLGKEINSKSNDSYGSFSSDGKVLYFTSDRKGGLGDMDIYKSELDNKGAWGKPVNMGPGINTPFNEASPFMSESGNRLYFSSEGHDGMGGYDIFYYDLDHPEEGAVNLGYPLNTTHNDIFYVPQGDGTSGYYAFSGEDTYGDRDIYSVTLLPEETAQEPEAEPVAEEAAVAPAVVPEIPPVIAEVSIPDPEPVIEPVADTIPEPTVEEPAPPDIVEETPPVQNEPVQNIETPVIADVPAVTNEILSNAASFRVQIMALKKPVDLSYFANLTEISVMYTSDSWYRVMVGLTSSETEAKDILEETIRKGYKDAFIRPASVFPRFTIQIMAVPGPVVDLSKFSNLPEIIVTRGEDHFCRYSTGAFASREEAVNYLSQVKAMGYSAAFVTAIK